MGIDLVWVTCLLQIITDCFRKSGKIIKKLLLHVDIGGHGDCSAKLFRDHKRCYDGQWPLTGHYFKYCASDPKISWEGILWTIRIQTSHDLQRSNTSELPWLLLNKTLLFSLKCIVFFPVQIPTEHNPQLVPKTLQQDVNWKVFIGAISSKLGEIIIKIC